MKKISVRKSPVDGKGLFADENIERGERIEYIRGKRRHKVIHNARESRKIEHWIGMGKDLWMTTEGTPFRYINHSCDPNAAIVGSKTLVALRKIPADAEICIDYSMTDADPFWELKCTCGSPRCRHSIRAIYTVPEDVFKRHLPYITKPFQRLYLANKAHKDMLQDEAGSTSRRS